jgi:hypothetical protein
MLLILSNTCCVMSGSILIQEKKQLTLHHGYTLEEKDTLLWEESTILTETGTLFVLVLLSPTSFESIFI